MKNSVILNTEQVKRLQETGTVAVVELVSEKYIINDEPDRYKCLGIGTETGMNGALFEDLRPDITPWVTPIPAPYQPGQQVYVREAWLDFLEGGGEVGSYIEYSYKSDNNEGLFFSPATMPKEAARLFPVVASVECVRCNSVHEDDILNIVETMIVPSGGDDYYDYYRNYLGSQKVEDWPWFNTPPPSLKSFIISKFGQSAWDNNAFIFITTFKIDKCKKHE